MERQPSFFLKHHAIEDRYLLLLADYSEAAKDITYISVDVPLLENSPFRRNQASETAH